MTTNTTLDLILAAENGDFDDYAERGYLNVDEMILACAEAIYTTGLHRSVGWAGRFLRDVHDAFGYIPGGER